MSMTEARELIPYISANIYHEDSVWVVICVNHLLTIHPI